MSFSRRYLTWLLLPPALFTLLAFGFLSQVIQLTLRTGVVVGLLLALLYGGVALGFVWLMRDPLEAVEQAVAGQGDVSKTMSRCLDRTKSLSAMLWLGGGLLFAIMATLTVMRSGLGFAYFLVAALIAAFPSLAW